MSRGMSETDQLRALIERAGGLHTQAGLARRWGVSKAYISEATGKDHFPPPATLIDERPVWTGTDADTWRATPRKPGPVPRA